MPTKPAVFFDRDNTLIISDGYLKDVGAVRLMPGAAEAVAALRMAGFAIVVVSNQSGVARGLMTEADVRAVNEKVEELLRREHSGAVIDGQYFCPFHPEGEVADYRQDSELRKPRPGMLFRAATALGLDLGRSWMIGDSPRDITAGHAAGCRTILFTPGDVCASPAAREEGVVKPDFCVTTLAAAAEIVMASRSKNEELVVLKKILEELKAKRGHGGADVSIRRMIAYVFQLMAVGMIVMGMLVDYRDRVTWLLLGIALQGLVISLLLMSERRRD